jgi:hypothetical protein
MVTLTLSLKAYEVLPVHTIQAILCMSPIVVHTMAFLSGLEETNIQYILIVVFVSLGAGSVIHGEVNGSLPGYTYQFLALMSIGLRAIYMKQITVLRGLDPLSILSLLSPLTFCSLVVPALYVEWGEVTFAELFRAKWSLLGNGIVAVGLQLSTIFIVTVASATEYAMIGTAKDLAVILASAIFFHAHISGLQYVGFVVVIFFTAAFVIEKQKGTAKK